MPGFRFMSWLIVLVLGLSAPWVAAEEAPLNKLTAAEVADGWILLFDGETFFGWRKANEADWKITNGVISVGEGEQGLLHTSAQFSDYLLRVDFRAAAGTNSGIFLRTSPKPKDPKADCYELNIAPADNPFPTGSFVGRKKVEGEFQSADWQTFEVKAVGAKIEVQLNGKPILSYDDPAPLGRGYIGLQLNKGKVEFRNVKLKPLSLPAILNGKDLSGWKATPGSKCETSVSPSGELKLLGGKGALEYEKPLADFVLQMECFVHKPGLNSGLFFRSIPGQEMNGYESQIHNGFKEGDRTKPVDCGTGGIFRRVDARRVVGDDNAWVHKTLVADGAHFAVWVNGYQVTDWTDLRKDDPNPRKGRRLTAGTLQLQGHDPTSEVSFRNFRGAELGARKGM